MRQVLMAVAGGVLVASVVVAVSTRGDDAFTDYVYYRDVGERWLTDGTYYTPRQLTGEPYPIVLMSDVLYPPTALLLFVPFVFLPAVLWWVVPLGLLAVVVWSLRPSAWAWVAILALAAWPRTFGAVLFGNTDMWVAAGVAAGIRWGWPAALIALKPTLLPLGIVGIRHPSTWLVAGILVLVGLPLARDYYVAMSNILVDDAIAYAAVGLPFALIPIVAWLGRTGATRSEGLLAWPSQRRAGPREAG